MNKVARNLEFVLGVALVWGAVWMIIAFTVGNIIWILDPDSIDPGEEPYILSLWIGLFGSIFGTAFGLLLWIVEKGKTLFELSLGRVAAWGFLVSASLPLLAGKDLRMILFLGPLGAISALASIGVLRRGISQVKSN